MEQGGSRDGRAGTVGDPSLESLVHELWLAQHELDLVTVSEELRGATYRYARHMTVGVRGEPYDGDWGDHARAIGVSFMEAARKDLWPPADRERVTGW